MLTIRHLVKSFSDGRRAKGSRVLAVDDVSLHVEQGQFYTLLGPSGCGKTTTLRSIAGLEAPDSGEILADGRVLFSSEKRISVPANQRGLGMVFQSYAIWPHMNVFQNVAFPLRVGPKAKRRSRVEISALTERALAIVQLDHLSSRPATDLSGGQQQRLALARALVMEPPLLLLDEPLSNLDAKLREAMRIELKRLQKELNITAIYVTHDQIEALALSDCMAVLNNGKIEQIGSPQEVYNRPSSRFVADFIGSSNFFKGTVERRLNESQYLVRTACGQLAVDSQATFAPGSNAMIGIRPEHVSFRAAEEDPGGLGIWRGRISTAVFLGDSVEYGIDLGDIELTMRCHPSTNVSIDTEVDVRLPSAYCALLPTEN